MPLASERSAGKRVPFAGSELEVRALSDESIQGLDLVLSSAGGAVSSEWAPRMVDAGAVVVDNTSFWRMHEDVPLVVAEVNPDHPAEHRGLVANPNCTTMELMVAVAPIQREAGLERLIVSTYQSVSGTGRRAIAELREQTQAVLAGEQPVAEVFPHPIAFNVLPQVETFKDGDDYTTEERKVMAETRKVLGIGDEVGISATCARVPVVTGHSISANVETKRDLSPAECRELLAGAPGLVVVDSPGEGIYPLPRDVEGRDEVLVGRIRRDPSHNRCLNLWVVGDNLRKGAATNAVQVAELYSSSAISCAFPSPSRRSRSRPGAPRIACRRGLRVRRVAADPGPAAGCRGRALGRDEGDGALGLRALGRPGSVLGLADVVDVNPDDPDLFHLVELALILTLFADGLIVERELLAMHWGPPARAIVFAMPLTLGILALIAAALFGELSWAEAFLLAAVLTPTDPVVTSAVVTAQRVPSRVRHPEPESGLNDGLALPFVLFFLVLATAAADAGSEGVKLLGEAAFGAVLGVVFGIVGGRVHRAAPAGGITGRYEGIYAVGLGIAAYGLADLTFGNGLIAAFVTGIALGATEHEIPDRFHDFAENVSSISR